MALNDDDLIEVDIDFEPETIEILEFTRDRLEAKWGRPVCFDEALNYLLDIARGARKP